MLGNSDLTIDYVVEFIANWRETDQDKQNIIKQYIAQGKHFDAISGILGSNILHYAVLYDLVTEIKIILDTEPKLLNLTNYGDPNGYTPLYLATRRRNIEVVRQLLSMGADKNIASGDCGRLPIHCAASRGFDDIVALFPEQINAKTQGGNIYGSTPLAITAKEGRISIVRKLIEMGANPDIYSGEAQWLPFYIAAQERRFEIAKHLMEYSDPKNLIEQFDKFLIWKKENWNNCGPKYVMGRKASIQEMEKLVNIETIKRIPEQRSLFDKLKINYNETVKIEDFVVNMREWSFNLVCHNILNGFNSEGCILKVLPPEINSQIMEYCIETSFGAKNSTMIPDIFNAMTIFSEKTKSFKEDAKHHVSAWMEFRDCMLKCIIKRNPEIVKQILTSGTPELQEQLSRLR